MQMASKPLGEGIKYLKQGGILVALGYMLYALWDSMERSRYLIAYQGAGEIPILWSPAFLTVALLCALATYFAQRGFVKTLWMKPLRVVVPIIGSVSSITLCLSRLAGETPSPFLIASFGLCIAWYILIWAEQFGSVGGWKTLVLLVVADALSAVLQFFFTQIMGSTALLITTAILPFCTSAMLFAVHRGETVPKNTSFKPESTGATTKPASAWGWLPALAVALFGMIYFMLRSVLYIQPSSYVDPSIIPIGSLATLGLLCILAFILSRKTQSVRTLIVVSLGLVAFLVIIAIIAIPFLHSDAIWSILVVMGNRCGFLMLVIGLSEITYRQKANPVSVFGAGFASLYFGYSLGGFLGVNLALFPNGVTSLLLGCSLIALICIGLAFFWLFREGRAKAEMDAPGNTDEAPPRNHLDQPSINSMLEIIVQDIEGRYGLSPREAEVFALLARGRSGTYISDALFISLNTTKKHVQNIYRKLGIHSSQELLDLIDFYSDREP